MPLHALPEQKTGKEKWTAYSTVVATRLLGCVYTDLDPAFWLAKRMHSCHLELAYFPDLGEKA